MKTVTFYRRNENMLGISYNSKSGQVTISGRSIQRDIRQRLNDAGLAMRGEIRVMTDARCCVTTPTNVTRANRRGGPNYKTYTWKIANIFAADAEHDDCAALTIDESPPGPEKGPFSFWQISLVKSVAGQVAEQARGIPAVTALRLDGRVELVDQRGNRQFGAVVPRFLEADA